MALFHAGSIGDDGIDRVDLCGLCLVCDLTLELQPVVWLIGDLAAPAGVAECELLLADSWVRFEYGAEQGPARLDPVGLKPAF